MPVDLGFAMTLTPKNAVEYFRSKGFNITFNWQEMEDAAHAAQFTVAGILKQDVLTDIHSALDNVLTEGKTLAQFRDDLWPLLERKGWTGHGLKADEDGVLEGKKLMPYRLDTIFRTNVQSAYMAGRYQRMRENVASRPYWQYNAIMDSRTRPAHAALHGRIFRWDDPIWRVIFPPNGYRCRCSVRALTQAQVDRHPVGVESSDGYLVTVQQPYGTGGEHRPVLAYRDPKTGDTVTPDAGFHANAGEMYLGNLGQQLLQRGERATPRLASIAVSDVLRQDRVLQAVTADVAEFVTTVRATPSLQGDFRHAGALLPAVLDAMPTDVDNAVIRLPGRVVLEQSGDTVSATWLQLPALLARPDVVLRDADGSLLYVIWQARSGTPRVARVAAGTQPEVADSWPLTTAETQRLQQLPVLAGSWGPL